LLTNNGAGVFVQASIPVTSTRPLRGVAVGQFVGGADLDVALLDGNAGQGTLTIYQGDGAGAFVAQPGQQTLTAPESLAARDFDGKNNDDLIGGFDGAVVVYENDGSGSFRASIYAADGPVTGLATGDLDDDTSPDATFGDAVAFLAGANELLLYGDYRTGAGFGDGGLLPTGAQPTAVAFGDADGDAFQDLFYADINSSVVTRTDSGQARVDYYGRGCPGTGQQIPHILPGGYPAPIQPNPLLSLEVTDAAPVSLVLYLVSLLPEPIFTGQACFPQVDLVTNLIAQATVSNAVGQASLPLPLTATINATGLALYCEAVVFDPNAPNIFGYNLSYSKGMKLRIGN